MNAIGSARRSCRGCGKERGRGRRRRRRQQPCLSSCSSSCCYPDSAPPAAFVSPSAAFWPLGPAAVDQVGLQSGRRASGAPASADWLAARARPLQRLRRRLGAGFSAIVTAAPERARKEVVVGVTFLCSLRDPHPGTPQPPPFERSCLWTPSGAGGRQFLFEIWEFLLPKGF